MTKNTNSNFLPGTYYTVLDKRWSNVVQTPGRKKGKAVYLVIIYKVSDNGTAHLSVRRMTSTLKRLRKHKYLSSESAGANEKSFVLGMVTGKINAIHVPLKSNCFFQNQDDLFNTLNNHIAFIKQQGI